MIAPYSVNVCIWTAGTMNQANSMVIRMNMTLCTCRTSSRVEKGGKKSEDVWSLGMDGYVNFDFLVLMVRKREC